MAPLPWRAWAVAENAAVVVAAVPLDDSESAYGAVEDVEALAREASESC